MTLSKYGKTCMFAILVPLAMPNDALAEICKPDNSLFNMPLLFGIAMIGATVGGMLHLTSLIWIQYFVSFKHASYWDVTQQDYTLL